MTALAALAATEDAGSIAGLLCCVPGVIAAAYILIIRGQR